jgi:hypothetical protein
MYEQLKREILNEFDDLEKKLWRYLSTENKERIKKSIYKY